MGKVIAGMTMSLDGYINDEKGTVDGLYSDFDELHDAPSFKKMIEDTGAVIMGRNVYEMADPFSWINDDYEFQTPIFVLTHTPPEKYPKGNDKLTLTFVTDGLESAITKAKSVAGGKMVQIIGGADTFQQAVNSGLCDELWIDIMPVILGKGTRLFENIDTEKIQLERERIDEVTSARTGFVLKIIK